MYCCRTLTLALARLSCIIRCQFVYFFDIVAIYKPKHLWLQICTFWKTYKELQWLLLADQWIPYWLTKQLQKNIPIFGISSTEHTHFCIKNLYVLYHETVSCFI